MNEIKEKIVWITTDPIKDEETGCLICGNKVIRIPVIEDLEKWK